MIQILENIKTVFSESAYSLVMETRENDLCYQQLEKDYNKLFDNIQDQLGKKHRKLMFKLESKQNEMGSIDDELIYLQGMLDCVALLRIIRLI